MSKYSLNIFQDHFNRYITEGHITNDLLNNITPAKNILNAESALIVYKNGFFARLTEALGEIFEGTWFILGDELFFSLCEKYIKRYNSSQYNLTNYGEFFCGFLKEADEVKTIPIVCDMAKFDWLFKELFHKRQHITVSTDELESILLNEQLKFYLGDAVCLFRSNFSVYDVWKFRHRPDSIDNVDLYVSENLLLYKKNEEIFIRKISEVEFRVISSLKKNPSVLNAIDISNLKNSNDIISVFQTIGETGIVSKITTI